MTDCLRRSWVLLAILATVVCSEVAAAQRNCKKGIPCGNSCIAANRTCRAGPPPKATPPAEPTKPTPSPAAQPLIAAPAPATSAVNADTTLPWVASATGATYYASACSGATRVVAGRLYFRSEENLKRLGMSRASAKEEECTLTQLQEHERRLAAVFR